jgi:plastocyanin
MTRRRVRGIAALLALGLVGPGAAAADAVVRGRVTLDLPGTAFADLGPVVVYLDGGPTAGKPAGDMPSVHQKDARFAPSFLAIAAGQNVAMPNDDRIFHNVFSYSKPNDFDLGLYPSGQSRTVPFRHPGVAKLYCSIHESMNGAIFVSPTPWFAVVGADGTFAVPGAPPGHWHLRTWNEKLPDTDRSIEVPAAGDLALQVSLIPGN